MERYVHARVHVKISNGVTNAGESSDRRDGEMPCRRPEFSRTRENFCLDDARLDLGELGRDDSEPNRPCRASRVACEPYCSSHSVSHIPPTQYFISYISCIPHLIFHIPVSYIRILHISRLTFLYNNSILFNWNASNCRKSLA